MVKATRVSPWTPDMYWTIHSALKGPHFQLRGMLFSLLPPYSILWKASCCQEPSPRPHAAVGEETTSRPDLLCVREYALNTRAMADGPSVGTL